MGWKTFKEKFKINDHIVSLDGNQIAIHDMDLFTVATINVNTGEITEILEGEIDQYEELLSASKSDLIEAAQCNDVFEKSVKLYSYYKKEIVEHQCENPLTSKVTHAGDLIIDGVHHRSKEGALSHRARNIKLEINYLREFSREMKDTCAEHESNKDGEIYKANKDGLDRILENISEKTTELSEIMAAKKEDQSPAPGD